MNLYSHHRCSIITKHWLFEELEFDELVFRDLVSQYYDHSSRWDHIRIDWDYHVDKKLHEKMFEKTYRMSFRAFRKLQLMLSSFLMKNTLKCRSSHPVPMHSVLAIGIRYLTGAKYHDLADVHGVSADTVYKCVHLFMSACLQCPDLEIKMPETASEWDYCRNSFASRSYRRIFKHCVGAIDGFFQPTQTPTKKDTVGNQRAYYSGHYKSHGLNCQAVCDGRLKFLYFGVVAPGGTNDSVAFFRTGISDFLNKTLPYPLHLVGDAAYIESDHLITPFTGSQKADPCCDAYNYYMSQCRIRIEMAFGRFSGKWSILQQKLKHKLETCSKILNVCARLHNYVIEEDYVDVDINKCSMEEHCITARRDAPFGMTYLPNVPDVFEQAGFSHVKLAYLHIIKTYDYRRPHHNVVRNLKEREEEIEMEYVTL